MAPARKKTEEPTAAIITPDITEYTLVTNRDPDRVVASVNRHIELGWRPIGGINVAVRHDPMIEVLFSQAMVR